MLDGLKRLFSRTGDAASAWAELDQWATSHERKFRPVRGEAEGFVVDGRLGTLPWRLEWGPSQRPYLQGMELRVRAELGVPAEVQALVMDRALQAVLEKQMFDHFVEDVQTRMDAQTPPEMRWLVLFGKLSGSELGALRERYVALAAHRGWLLAWLDGKLTASLQAHALAQGQSVVLMISRGRLTMRTALGDPAPAELERWLRLFQVALREARRAAEAHSTPGVPSTQPSMFSATRSAQEEDPPPAA